MCILRGRRVTQIRDTTIHGGVELRLHTTDDLGDDVLNSVLVPGATTSIFYGKGCVHHDADLECGVV